MEGFINRLKTGNPIRLPTHLRYGSKDEEVTVVPAEKKPLSSTVPSNSESDLATSESRLANSKKPKILLVIDSPETDWSAIFKDRTLHEGVYDIRVEQAQFCDLNLASYSDTGTMVDIQVYRAGTVVVRSFRPDFVLVRQHVRGIGPKEDWRNILLGLMFGNVPSVNSLSSIYNFAEKPWVFAQLIQIQKKLGKDVFPLIEQAYYPNHKEMLITPRFPVVVKVGHANSGYGKVCIQSHRSFQDIASVVALCDCYATTEPFIPGKCDIRIQKIGDDYRVFKRTSISDNWKTNTGSAMLEEIELTDSYKLWADECSKMFGGLDILCVEAIQGKNKKEYIIEVNDTAMRLFHETLDEDHKRIADLVIKKMEKAYPPVIQATTPTAAALSGAFNVISAPGSQTATAAVSEDKKESSDKGWKKNGLFSGIID